VLVPPDDVETLAKEIVRLLDDPAARGRLGDAGRRRVRDELCWEHQAAVYLGAIARA
jgi:glycosyltransferase involved in cell wall biosynthesis